MNKKKSIKKTVFLLVGLLLLSFNLTSFASSNIMPESLLENPNNLTVTDSKSLQPSSKFNNYSSVNSTTGKYLFSMNITSLSYDNLLTTKSSGKSVKDYEVPNGVVGILNSLSSTNKIGLCTHNYIDGVYNSVGSKTFSSWERSGSFEVAFPYATAYGYVRNVGSSSTAGQASFYSN